MSFSDVHASEPCLTSRRESELHLSPLCSSGGGGCACRSRSADACGDGSLRDGLTSATCSEASVERRTHPFADDVFQQNLIVCKMVDLFDDLKKFIVDQIQVAVRDLRCRQGGVAERESSSVGSPSCQNRVFLNGLTNKPSFEQAAKDSPSKLSANLSALDIPKSICKTFTGELGYRAPSPTATLAPVGERSHESTQVSSSYWPVMESLQSSAMSSQARLSATSRVDDNLPLHREPEKAVQNQREELARKLIEDMFDYEELADSNVTGVKGKRLLNPDKIWTIREAVFYRHPVTAGESEDDAWKIVCEKINAKCRGVTRTLKRKFVGDGVDEPADRMSHFEAEDRTHRKDSNNNSTNPSSAGFYCSDVKFSPFGARLYRSSISDIVKPASSTPAEARVDRNARVNALDPAIALCGLGREASSSVGSDSYQKSENASLPTSRSDSIKSPLDEKPHLTPPFNLADRRPGEKASSLNDVKIKTSYLHDFLGDSLGRSDLEHKQPSVGGDCHTAQRGQCEIGSEDEVFDDDTVVVVQEETSAASEKCEDEDRVIDSSSVGFRTGSAAARALQLSREEMCRSLVESMFSRHELANSNVTGARGKAMLDPVKIEKIRDAIFKKYPAHGVDEVDWLWRILVTKINTKCRGVKRLLKRSAHYDVRHEESRAKSEHAVALCASGVVPYMTPSGFKSRDVSVGASMPSMVDSKFRGNDAPARDVKSLHVPFCSDRCCESPGRLSCSCLNNTTGFAHGPPTRCANSGCHGQSRPHGDRACECSEEFPAPNSTAGGTIR